MFADVEIIVRDFLALHVEVPVRTRVPVTRPVEFVRVWRTGGAAVNRVLDRPIMTVQAWAASDPRASELAGRCRDVIYGASTGMTLVRGVEEVSGLYYDPDPDLNSPRYTFTFQANVRAKF